MSHCNCLCIHIHPHHSLRISIPTRETRRATECPLEQLATASTIYKDNGPHYLSGLFVTTPVIDNPVPGPPPPWYPFLREHSLWANPIGRKMRGRRIPGSPARNASLKIKSKWKTKRKGNMSRTQAVTPLPQCLLKIGNRPKIIFR